MTRLRYPVEKFIRSTYQPDIGGFRFTPNGEVTLLSTCFGVQLCFLLQKTNLIDKKKTEKFILNQRLGDGTFLDKDFSSKELTGRQSEKYLIWQFTFFSLTALDMLGCNGEQNLEFLDAFKDEQHVKSWLADLDFKDFWYSSNEVMFLLFFIAFRLKKEPGSDRFTNSVSLIFDFLDRTQDPESGYWGERSGNDFSNGMYGAAHIYLFYQHFNKVPSYVDQIVSNTVLLQRSNGLYDSFLGGACEDYDGVEILLRMLNWGADTKVITDSVKETYNTLVMKQHSTGGYPYRIPSLKPSMLIRRVIERLTKADTYKFSGWEKMASNVYSPDMWSTYFRFLTIANTEISLGLPQSYPYVSYDLPSWGYLTK